jgi:hypothetical protein
MIYSLVPQASPSSLIAHVWYGTGHRIAICRSGCSSSYLHSQQATVKQGRKQGRKEGRGLGTTASGEESVRTSDESFG